MKCDMCESEATVFLTQIVKGQMTQVNLCEKCSKDKGVTDPMGFQLADCLLGSQKKSRPAPDPDESLACPTCGFTRAHLKKIGRLGCPECYKTFGDDLEAMLRAMHKGTRHVGKAPGRTPVMLSLGAGHTHPHRGSAPAAPPAPPQPLSPAGVKKRLGELRDAIERAVSEERYEDAAKLRDEMRELETKA